MSSFGWGQRQCLGQSLTEDELLIACGALAWCFHLRPKRDAATGLDLPVPVDKSNSLLIIKPDPFEMAFEPRSETLRQEALRLWTEAEARDRQQRADFLKRSRTTNEIKKVPCEITTPEVSLLDEKKDATAYRFAHPAGSDSDVSWQLLAPSSIFPITI